MNLGLALIILSGRDILIITVFSVLFGSFSLSLSLFTLTYHIALISRHHVIKYIKFPVLPSHLRIIPIRTMY
jgi:membrane protein YqaA with SNARE-associated domain